MIAKNIDTLENTKSIIDSNKIEEVVKKLENSRKIYIIVVGFSGIVGNYFANRLKMMGYNVIYETDIFIQFNYLATLTSEDVLFVISYSGRIKEILELVEIAKNKKATV